jgi:hypothetical protein
MHYAFDTADDADGRSLTGRRRPETSSLSRTTAARHTEHGGPVQYDAAGRGGSAVGSCLRFGNGDSGRRRGCAVAPRRV